MRKLFAIYSNSLSVWATLHRRRLKFDHAVIYSVFIVLFLFLFSLLTACQCVHAFICSDKRVGGLMTEWTDKFYTYKT